MRMRLSNLRQDRATAGTTVLLSLIVSLFVIGLLVMIFALMGSSLRTASFDSTTVSVSNETGSWLNSTTYTVDNSGANGFSGLTITSAINTTDNSSIGTGNFTVVGAGFTNATATTYASVWVSYTYVYNTENVATEIINDTTNALASSTDFFDLFIVIGSMVVLILLTVIIIVAIRNSGMMDAGGTA